MRKALVLVALLVSLFSYGSVFAALPAHTEELVKTNKLDCTVIRPWSDSPNRQPYPLIAWANGWDNQHNDTTAGYKRGLIEWAVDGPYIVVAANSRSPKESDVLACLQWIVDQDSMAGSEYEGVVATDRIGLAGHSQGAGVMINATEIKAAFNIVGVVAMNPYAPNWHNADVQDGPVMVIGGTADTVVPVSTYTRPAWEAIKSGGQGGLMAVLEGGDHSSDAWGPPGVDPNTTDFGNYQHVTQLWWRKTLSENSVGGRVLKTILDHAPWTTEYGFTATFDLR